MNREKKKSKFKKGVIVSTLVFLSLVVIGASYALFSQILYGQKKYVLESGGLKVYLDESKHDTNITVSNSLPVLDETGMKNDAYNFSLVNEEEEDLEYTIYLKEEQIENKTPAEVIRYYYTRDVDNIKKIRGMTEQQDEEGNYFLETGVLPAKSTYNYTFRMWLSYEADESVMGTKYSVHLEVNAKQSLYVYKEEALNGCDPVLSANLVPVMIESDGTVKKTSLGKKWYDYTNKEWANAVVLVDDTKEYTEGEVIPEANIESYFVWIPRYKYKIFNDTVYTGVTTLENRVQEIEIEFENKETAKSTGTTTGSWLTHPAFVSFDTNGFWVGKFESGYKGATTTTEAQVNSSAPEKLQIKPNVYSWRNITVGNAFKASYDYLRSDESHMMKNTEWGAVAYLQHSKYGSSMSVRNNNNRSYKTGYASVTEPTLGYNSGTSIEGNKNGTTSDVTLPYNTPTGYTASTTGNITGIYDTSGGAWEYVMGYNINANSVGGSSELTSIYGDFFTNSRWEKYYDQYSNAEVDASKYQTGLLGDATREMGPFGTVKDPDGSSRYRTSWYGDLASFVNPVNPWFERGGFWAYGVQSGVFGVSYSSGGVNTSLSFRVVLTP